MNSPTESDSVQQSEFQRWRAHVKQVAAADVRRFFEPFVAVRRAIRRVLNRATAR